MKTTLGETGTEQFEVCIEVNEKVIYQQLIHDPFITTTTVIGVGWGEMLKCLLTGKQCERRVRFHVSGSPWVMKAIMDLNPFEMTATSADLVARNLLVAEVDRNMTTLYHLVARDAPHADPAPTPGIGMHPMQPHFHTCPFCDLIYDASYYDATAPERRHICEHNVLMDKVETITKERDKLKLDADELRWRLLEARRKAKDPTLSPAYVPPPVDPGPKPTIFDRVDGAVAWPNAEQAEELVAPPLYLGAGRPLKKERIDDDSQCPF